MEDHKIAVGRVTCPACKGSGTHAHLMPRGCMICDGHGSIMRAHAQWMEEVGITFAEHPETCSGEQMAQALKMMAETFNLDPYTPVYVTVVTGPEDDPDGLLIAGTEHIAHSIQVVPDEPYSITPKRWEDVFGKDEPDDPWLRRLEQENPEPVQDDGVGLTSMPTGMGDGVESVNYLPDGAAFVTWCDGETAIFSADDVRVEILVSDEWREQQANKGKKLCLMKSTLPSWCRARTVRRTTSPRALPR